MSTVDEAAVRAAVKKHKDYIMKNLDTITLKSLRGTLEQEMGLGAGALKPHKMLLSTLIDKLIYKHKAAAAAQEAAQEEAPAKEQAPPSSGKKQQRKKKKEEVPVSSDVEEEAEDEEDEDEEEVPRKRRKQEGKPAKQSGPRQYGRAVEKLRSICKAATITIPPSLYSRNKGSEADLQAALESLLEKHGLDADAGEREIVRAKARLQQQRDLDGIDTSNIIEGGQRRRAAAAPVSYKTMVDLPSDIDDEEEEEQEEESDEEQGSEGAAGSGSEREEEEEEQQQEGPATGKRAKKKMARKAESEDEASSSGSEQEEEEETAAGGSRGAKTPAAAKSPDENTGARSNANSARTGSQQGKPAPASKAKARPADSLQDSDGEQPAAQPAKRRVVDWSDDDE